VISTDDVVLELVVVVEVGLVIVEDVVFNVE
jgi:hypothetical protein